MANNERQANIELNDNLEARKSEGWKNADGSLIESDIKMISGEGLTPGYEGFSQFVDNSVEKIGAVPTPESVSEPVEQMSILLQKKIEATLAGDAEKAESIQKMIDLHAERNNISQ